MSSIGNFFEFGLQSKAFEQQAYDGAIEQAQQRGEQEIQRPYQATRQICTQAFNIFKKNLEETFPGDHYQDLIALTLQAREKKFFFDLKERVLTILQK